MRWKGGADPQRTPRDHQPRRRHDGVVRSTASNGAPLGCGRPVYGLVEDDGRARGADIVHTSTRRRFVRVSP